MHAVRIDFDRERQVIVHDKRYAVRTTNPKQRNGLLATPG
jgi:hypothetical protein